jgi:hypothetical protein
MMWDTIFSVDVVPIGAPITFMTGGLKGAPPMIEGIVEENLDGSFLSVRDFSGDPWLVTPFEIVEVHEVH